MIGGGEYKLSYQHSHAGNQRSRTNYQTGIDLSNTNLGNYFIPTEDNLYSRCNDSFAAQ